jgi:hypothetical protein
VLAAARRSFLVKALLLALALAAATALIGLVTLWPEGARAVDVDPGSRQQIERATVDAVRRIECRAPGRFECTRVTVRLRSGPDEGKLARFTVGETTSDVRLSVGDRIRVYRLVLPEGAEVLGRPFDRYGFSDYERQRPLALLTVLFCGLVIITGRLRGLRALVGLALSLLIVIEFLVPAILDGRSAVGVALVAALAIMFVTIPLAHGLGAKGIAAMLGTAAALGLTALLASFAVDAVHLTGIASDESAYLRAVAGTISLRAVVVTLRLRELQPWRQPRDQHRGRPAGEAREHFHAAAGKARVVLPGHCLGVEHGQVAWRVPHPRNRSRWPAISPAARLKISSDRCGRSTNSACAGRKERPCWVCGQRSSCGASTSSGWRTCATRSAVG